MNSLLMANSLVDGFVLSSFIGRGIVIAQIIGSVIMVAAICGKLRELGFVSRSLRRFTRDFSTSHDVLEYYFERRPTIVSGVERIYKDTCERLLKLITPDPRAALTGDAGARPTVLSKLEIELVNGTCEHALTEEETSVEHGMTVIATVVALSPMLGLLGTVWGVLDAFAEMGSAGSASLATIAPSISSALVTTVVGLLIAIPGVVAFNKMNSDIRGIQNDMEGFADELTGRIACEFQGKGV